MSDQELLEYAAKALQLHIKGHLKCDAGNLLYLWVGQKLTKDKSLFNPLTDDDDALRLAVKLLFEIYIGRGSVEVRHSSGIKVLESFNLDPCAATRRAIVRAAAELAKGNE